MNTIDVSGLPQPVVEDIHRLIATLRGNLPAWGSRPDLPPVATTDDLDGILEELCADLPVLPTLSAGFSRADIYSEHD